MVLLRPLPRSLGGALACAAACLLLLAPGATAASSQAPPGNAGVREYVESVPDGSGDRVGNTLYHGRNTALQEGRGFVESRAGQRLAREGRNGELAAGLAAASAPKTARSPGDAGDGGRSTLGSAVRRLGAADGPGGMGGLLPLLLVLLLGAAGGYAFRRRQAGS